jgi:hypothetical protein
MRNNKKEPIISLRKIICRGRSSSSAILVATKEIPQNTTAASGFQYFRRYFFN